MNTNNALGTYLKSLRKQHLYSQEFVASYLNIIRQTYSHYETGRITPPLDALNNLALLYEIPIDSFLSFVIHNTPYSITEISSPEIYDKPSMQEAELLMYYRLLDERDKNDILDFIRIKGRRNKSD